MKSGRIFNQSWIFSTSLLKTAFKQVVSAVQQELWTLSARHSVTSRNVRHYRRTDKIVCFQLIITVTLYTNCDTVKSFVVCCFYRAGICKASHNSSGLSVSMATGAVSTEQASSNFPATGPTGIEAD